MKVLVLQIQDLWVHTSDCMGEVRETEGIFPETMLGEVIELARKPVRTDDHDRHESQKGDTALFGLPRTDVVEFELGIPDEGRKVFSRFYNRKDKTFTESRPSF